MALRNQAGAEKTNFTLRHYPPFRSLDKPEPVRLEGSCSLAPVVGSGGSKVLNEGWVCFHGDEPDLQITAGLPRSEHENLESDLRGGRKRLFFDVPFSDLRKTAKRPEGC